MKGKVPFYVVIVLFFLASCSSHHKKSMNPPTSGSGDPIDGDWSEWMKDRECEDGVQKVFRTCTNPAPKNGGNLCEGDSEKFVSCTVEKIDGGWSEWENEGGCTNDSQKQVRTCTNPTPKNGGNRCEGKPQRMVSCEESPQDGGWSEWVLEGSCLNGLQKEIRTCTNPSPLYGGKLCEGGSMRKKSCMWFRSFEKIEPSKNPDYFGFTIPDLLDTSGWTSISDLSNVPLVPMSFDHQVLGDPNGTLLVNEADNYAAGDQLQLFLDGTKIAVLWLKLDKSTATSIDSFRGSLRKSYDSNLDRGTVSFDVPMNCTSNHNSVIYCGVLIDPRIYRFQDMYMQLTISADSRTVYSTNIMKENQLFRKCCAVAN